jgi:hypothetical protein
MTKRPVLLAVAMGALLCSTLAPAEMFKCTGPDGKIVFSDTRCEGPAATPSAAPGAAKSRNYELTSADRDRIRVLEAMGSKAGAYSEQKTAAQLEIQNIRRGAEARLSTAERERREALSAELSSDDPKKRNKALGDLREIYSR